MANDDESVVRIAAATALGRIGDLSARAALASAEQRDPDRRVRAAAREALASFEKDAIRGRAVELEEATGDGVGKAALAGLKESLARHLLTKGFSVLPAGSNAPYRIKPSILSLDIGENGGRVTITAKASVIAIARDGRMELLQSGARLKASSGSPDKLTARAFDAIAKDLAEDLADKLR